MASTGRHLLLMAGQPELGVPWADALSSALSADICVRLSPEPESEVAQSRAGLIVLDWPMAFSPRLLRARVLALAALRHGDVPILLCIADPSVRDKVNAQRLGIAVVCDRREPSSVLAERCVNVWQDAVDRRLGTMVDRTGGMMAATMRTVRAGGFPDTMAMKAVAEQIAGTVADEGLSQWIDRVRPIGDQACRHCFLIGGVTAFFLQRLGVRASDVVQMTEAVLFHDIGKALVPLALLDKPGPLTARETEIMRLHPALGHDLLVRQGGHNAMTLSVTRHHHEHLDGAGYPDRLSGREVSDAVRVATICDIFAALIEPRLYKAALTPAEAIATMKEMKGAIDMDILTAFEGVMMPALSTMPAMKHAGRDAVLSEGPLV
ncbi:HD-GYP domain-containing protein [Neoasaia chiangmaiensis]|nr:HD domain-containing phosphohydrolase [Neoasaia chiangmaiensis]